MPSAAAPDAAGRGALLSCCPSDPGNPPLSAFPVSFPPLWPFLSSVSQALRSSCPSVCPRMTSAPFLGDDCDVSVSTATGMTHGPQVQCVPQGNSLSPLSCPHPGLGGGTQFTFLSTTPLRCWFLLSFPPVPGQALPPLHCPQPQGSVLPSSPTWWTW